MKLLAHAVLIVVAACVAPTMASNAPASPQSATTAASAQKPDDLDRLLAPIALYPDTLLGQVLLCATNPGKVGALAEWLSSQSAKGTALQDAARGSGFQDSFVAIVLFPDVVLRMAAEIDWTTRVGRAFTGNRSAVFASIQRLRAKARAAGTLRDTAQQQVETRTTSTGQQVIVIEPANPQVVYVPQYDAQTVYVPAASSSTVVVTQDDDSGAAVAAGLIGFTAGIAIGAAIDNDYYYGPYGWGGGFHMYDDAWDDWYDHREDAREDWMEHREDVIEDRGERAEHAREERTERTETRQENRPDAQAQRTERQQTRRGEAQERSTSSTAMSSSASSAEARGYSRDAERAGAARSGTRSDAFSGYSSGRSERAASSRGQRSRSSRSGGRRR